VIQCHILREKGVAIAGPAPRTLIDPIGPGDLRQAVLGILRAWWAPMLHDPAHLHSCGYRTYAILTMCRMLYTLHYGLIVSKPVAARWARETLDGKRAALIDWAWAGWPDAEPGNLNETLDFIRYTLERSRHFEALAAPV